ncbi:uncharacterized protein LOC131255798 isoform X2 [Magnolia sinica]|uniref:uncharacterized protein LOC131255798 isoform X2 n=1 Tax=Magnolia sinica TaxID=86752 RepID=UPI0026596F33|nr:uncharacterized protein LOC131255798 isoform X2 [Magnolia sinica]
MCYMERTLGFHTRALDDRDIRLVTDIVGGAVRWRCYLDHLILSLCNDENTFRRMEPLLLQILRIGFYEILKLDMPPYAVVDEVRFLMNHPCIWMILSTSKPACRLSYKRGY